MLVLQYSLGRILVLYQVLNRFSAWKPCGKLVRRHGMMTPLLEISAKTRRNLGESTTMESSIIVLIVVVETLDFACSREPQQAQIPMVVLQTSC